MSEDIFETVDLATRLRELLEEVGELARRASRVDLNQGEIVARLVAAGARVQSLAAHGRNVPDLLVGFKGKNYLLEVKNPETHGHLSTGQRQWHEDWSGQVAVVTTPDEALRVIGARK